MVTSIEGIELREPRFEVILGREVDKADASTGTMARGKAVSPYDNLVIDGDHIKEAAQSGDMSQLLYAVAVRKPSGERTFRAPNEADLQALQAANRTFDAVKDEWFDAGILPTEEFPEGNDLRPKHYGLDRWVDFFTPRQALVHGTFGEEFAYGGYLHSLIASHPTRTGAPPIPSLRVTPRALRTRKPVVARRHQTV